MSKIPKHDMLIGFLVIVSLSVILGCLAFHGMPSVQLRKPPATAPAATQTHETPRVTGAVEYAGSRYLIWSNGEITPDMADHRKFVVRAMAAQAILEEQKAIER